MISATVIKAGDNALISQNLPLAECISKFMIPESSPIKSDESPPTRTTFDYPWLHFSGFRPDLARSWFVTCQTCG
jgi:hypothetical protein